MMEGVRHIHNLRVIGADKPHCIDVAHQLALSGFLPDHMLANSCPVGAKMPYRVGIDNAAILWIDSRILEEQSRFGLALAKKRMILLSNPQVTTCHLGRINLIDNWFIYFFHFQSFLACLSHHR